MDTYKVTLTFTEPLLGTVPLNKELYAEFIGTKAAGDGDTEDELETVEEMTEKGTTGFHRVDGQPVLYDYVIKGFLKDACGMLRRASDSRSSKLAAYKRVIDGLVFVEPRRIPILVMGEEFVLERPLRAQTAQGPRVALARSIALPAGSSLSFTLTVLGGVPGTLLNEWFTYGALRGLGQWRNSGMGRFVYHLEKQ